MKRLVFLSFFLPVLVFGGDQKFVAFFSRHTSSELPALDPKLKSILDVESAREFTHLPIHQIRAISESRSKYRKKLDEPIAGMEKRTISSANGEIPIRIYTPKGKGPFPIALELHGGGWILGNLDTHDDLCSSIANRAECLVVAVDYRLAPEHKFPAALDDSEAALKWVAEHASEINGNGKIALIGDSAGGNLAAALALRNRDQSGPPIALQILVYPITNHGFETLSYFQNSKGYRLTRSELMYAWKQYLKEPTDGENPYASPLRAESLANLPPALILTAQYDVLRDDGESYAARLHQAGVPVRLTRYNDMIHGFITQAADYPSANKAVSEIAEALRIAYKR
jgi:acetyl esterase